MMFFLSSAVAAVPAFSPIQVKPAPAVPPETVVSGVRSWPDDGRFEAAVARGSYQHPRLSGITFDLESSVVSGRPGTEQAGSGPLLHALGASAVVFFGRRGPRGVALRCPTRDLGIGAARRYEKLAARRAASAPLALAVAEAEWIDEGVEIDGTWWPVIVMERVEGRSLAGEVEQVLGKNPAGLRGLARDWAGFVAVLGAADVAHGDLQQNNIFVTGDGRLKAVDLDGVWLPAVAHLPPDETGHRHYQHPRRQRGDWGRTVDTFSALVIYLSLVALAADPDLWERYHNGENLVFTDEDLAHPDRTPLWDRLSSSPDPAVRQLVPLLRELCHGPADSGQDLASLLDRHRHARTEGLVRPASLTRTTEHDDVNHWWVDPEAPRPDPDAVWFAPSETDGATTLHEYGRTAADSRTDEDGGTVDGGGASSNMPRVLVLAAAVFVVVFIGALVGFLTVLGP
ncbi:conserved exported hypothetical protein [Frankia canadensis]|uniref:Protein kinase domain-containing protein n=1 Tax=Frankia canadensis TaxID=1836972 RepID=A0A2I2KN86_9ACTN|nr:conserved exported hypothetical protein [Frankia canadensis]SOU54406.1 conserved exported hypothetical protein [Frankia canadensis]